MFIFHEWTHSCDIKVLCFHSYCRSALYGGSMVDVCRQRADWKWTAGQPEYNRIVLCYSEWLVAIERWGFWRQN